MATTAGHGFIGSELAERLLSDGHQVVVIDRFGGFYLLPKERNINDMERCVVNRPQGWIS
jgi:nucleoside-diphosphate-sugar epimerase